MFPKLVIKICIIPFLATFCSGVAETLESMHKTQKNAPGEVLEVVDEPPSTLGDLEVVVTPEEKEEAKPESIEDIFVRYFGDEANIMIAICTAESHLDPNSIGDGHLTFGNHNQWGMSVGLCQIRIMPTRGITIEQMKDPEENIKYAKMLSETKTGFGHWTMYKNGSYKKYLN